MANSGVLERIVTMTPTNPKTTAEWEQCVGMLVSSFQEGDKRPWNPGATLLGIEGHYAIIRPPHHHRNERVLLSTIKLWKKGNHDRDRIHQKHQVTQPSKPTGEKPVIMSSSRLPVYPAVPILEPAAIDARIPDPTKVHDTWFVARNRTTGLYLSPVGGSNAFDCTLEGAGAWEKKSSAQNRVSSLRWKGKITGPRIKICTIAEARVLDRQDAAKRGPAGATIDKPAAADPIVETAETAVAAAEPIQFPVAPIALHEEDIPPTPQPPAPVAPALPTLAEIAENARRKNVWEAWAQALRDEAAAEAMFLEAQGKRRMADINMKIEQQRQDWKIS